MASKILTREQATSRKAAAVRFAENVLDDPERKGITLVDNPPGERSLEMANSNMSKDELLDYIDELESENSDLQDQLDAVADIVSPPAGDDTDDDDSDDDDAAVAHGSDYLD